jgi:hypothetical protein
MPGGRSDDALTAPENLTAAHCCPIKLLDGQPYEFAQRTLGGRIATHSVSIDAQREGRTV